MQRPTYTEEQFFQQVAVFHERTAEMNIEVNAQFALNEAGISNIPEHMPAFLLMRAEQLRQLKPVIERLKRRKGTDVDLELAIMTITNLTERTAEFVADLRVHRHAVAKGEA